VCLLLTLLIQGQTPLHQATGLSSDLRIIKMLIREHPLTLLARTLRGKTPREGTEIFERSDEIKGYVTECEVRLLRGDLQRLSVFVEGDEKEMRRRCLSEDRLARRSSFLFCVKCLEAAGEEARGEGGNGEENGVLDIELAIELFPRDVWSVVLSFI